jgi:hypothetical protein
MKDRNETICLDSNSIIQRLLVTLADEKAKMFNKSRLGSIFLGES